jgi:hypothetical protein
MGKSTDFLINFVRGYLDGENSRLDLDLDYDHYLSEHYPQMERENPALAECFAFYLGGDEIDQARELSDSECKKIVRKQFNKFMAAWKDGFY